MLCMRVYFCQIHYNIFSGRKVPTTMRIPATTGLEYSHRYCRQKSYESFPMPGGVIPPPSREIYSSEISGREQQSRMRMTTSSAGCTPHPNGRAKQDQTKKKDKKRSSSRQRSYERYPMPGGVIPPPPRESHSSNHSGSQQSRNKGSLGSTSYSSSQQYQRKNKGKSSSIGKGSLRPQSHPLPFRDIKNSDAGIRRSSDSSVPTRDNRVAKTSFDRVSKGSSKHFRSMSSAESREIRKVSSASDYRSSSALTQPRYSNSSSTEAGCMALFGAYGKTGHHFLRLALDAGYKVRALLLPGLPASENLVEEFGENKAVSLITGTLEEKSKVRRVLKRADYVVCMLNDTLSGKNEEYPVGCLTSFIQLLYPLMRKESSIKVFLYQASSLATDINGSTPVLSKIVKSVLHGQNEFIQDQDSVIRHVALEHGHHIQNRLSTGESMDDDSEKGQEHLTKQESIENSSSFKFIVTRPTVFLRDGPSKKKLAASKSQPGPFPISHVDLADFSLNALLKKKIHNSCPYVVADTF